MASTEKNLWPKPPNPWPHINKANPIHLSKLSLNGFRNHLDTNLELCPGLTLFRGQNGHGKSNLLEAAYMMAIAKSPRSVDERELVNWSLAETGGHMQVLGIGRDGDKTIQAQIDVDIAPPAASSKGPGAFRKGLRVNGIKHSAIDFVGNLNIVFFEADDLEIVSGSPGRRRRYLDILISQSNPSYLKSLQRYGQVVRQRNQLLRRIRDGIAQENELNFWDERLAYEGSRIVRARQIAVNGLNDHATPAHEELSGGDALELGYVPRIYNSATEAGEDTTMSHELIETEIAESLVQIRKREISQGMTAVGPHRDDVEIAINGKSAARFASRGQKRTIALSLKMAEVFFVRQSTGRTPVLALDDILSELDPDRRLLVLKVASESEQVLLTATETEIVPPEFISTAKIFNIRDGRVSGS